MKAQLGQIYALIVDNKLHKKFTVAELPEWADQIEQPGSLYILQVVNITLVVPMPNEGDIYDGVNFTAPPPPPPPTPEELARQARRAALVVEAADIFIDNLRVATAQQIRDFVQTNVTDLASAKVLMGKLSVAVAYTLSGGRDK